MLETDEVNDDYFTPAAMTSLANIFGKSLISDEKSEDKSLKYSPPKPQMPPKPEESQAVLRVFACALVGHEWVNNVYSAKGKIGCAIIKVNKDSSHHMLLYDSKKTTLSSIILSPKLEVTIKEREYISYYDSNQKYWSLYGSEDDINTILEYFKTSGVLIKESTQQSSGPPGESNVENVNDKFKCIKEFDVGSNTDSSVPKKTKASIVNRMANVGHSVLPRQIVSNDDSSDSSILSETDNATAARCIPVTNFVKKNMEQVKTDTQEKTSAPKIGHLSNNNPPVFDNQLITMQSASVNTSPTGNDNNLLLTEQRINNSELRININRLNDKLDTVMNKINQLENKKKNEETANMNAEIFEKLLKEYETKLKTYEDLYLRMNIAINAPQRSTPRIHYSRKNIEINLLKNKVTELQTRITHKDKDICVLIKELRDLRDLNDSHIFRQNENELQVKISELEQMLLEKSEMITKLTIENEELMAQNNEKVENHIKSIMNNTFQAISANFKNGESYSGDSIKNIIAAVIKNITIESLDK